MVKVECECVVPMCAEDYWRVRSTPEFMEFSRVEQNLISLEVLEEWTEDGYQFQRIRTVPNVSIPRIVKPMLGGKPLEFVDLYETPLDVPPYHQSFTTTPPVLPNKIKVSGKLDVTPINDHECRQKLVASVEVSVWGAGKIISNIIVDNMKLSMANIPKLVAKYKLEREDALRLASAGRASPGRASPASSAGAPSPRIRTHSTRSHRSRADSSEMSESNTESEWYHDASEMHNATADDITDGYLTPNEDEYVEAEGDDAEDASRERYGSVKSTRSTRSTRSTKSVVAHGHSAAHHAEVLGYQAADASETDDTAFHSTSSKGSRTPSSRNGTTDTETVQYDTFAIGQEPSVQGNRRIRTGTGRSGYHEFDASPSRNRFSTVTRQIKRKLRRLLICCGPTDPGAGSGPGTSYRKIGGKRGEPMLSANFTGQETI